jgi:hypothetical protein
MSTTGKKTGGSLREGCHVARREWGGGGASQFLRGFSFHGQVTVGVFWDNKDDIIHLSVF